MYARFQEEFYRDDLNSSAARITTASHARSYFLSKESDGSDNIIIVLLKLVFILDMHASLEWGGYIQCSFFFFLKIRNKHISYGDTVCRKISSIYFLNQFLHFFFNIFKSWSTVSLIEWFDAGPPGFARSEIICYVLHARYWYQFDIIIRPLCIICLVGGMDPGVNIRKGEVQTSSAIKRLISNNCFIYSYVVIVENLRILLVTISVLIWRF